MEKKLGTTLKDLRKKKNLTAKDVSAKLKNIGYEISDKTISGYENGIRMPNADVFMALCQIYDCKNILEIFSFVKADYSIPTDDEWKIIETYRNLDVQGKETVRYIMTNEKKRMDELKITKERIAEMETETTELMPKRIMLYVRKLASAGNGEYLFDDIPTDFIEVEDTEISRKADFVIDVNGKSMEPDYCDGEKVFVKKATDLNIGEIGIFVQDNNCYIKQLGEDKLISINKKYRDITPTTNIQLVGKVLGKV